MRIVFRPTKKADQATLQRRLITTKKAGHTTTSDVMITNISQDGLQANKEG